MIPHNSSQKKQCISQNQIYGIPNVGNTCFINAIVNSWYASESFSEHLAKLQTSNKVVIYLKKIFSSIRNFGNLDQKANLMKNFTSLLSSLIQDYEIFLQQDALKFFMNIYNLAKQAFPPQLVLVSYQKVCQNYIVSPNHKNQKIFNFSNEIFMESCPEICQSCSEEAKRLIRKLSYLTKAPKNIITFGQDIISQLSVYKLSVQNPKFYVLYVKENTEKYSNDMKNCFKVLTYELKSRTLYKGSSETGHYIAVRKRIERQKYKSSGMYLEGKSQRFYKFDDIDVTLIDKRNLSERDKLWITKFTVYQKCDQQLSMSQFMKMYNKQFDTIIRQDFNSKLETLKTSSLQFNTCNSGFRQTIEERERRNNMHSIVQLYHILAQVKKRTSNPIQSVSSSKSLNNLMRNTSKYRSANQISRKQSHQDLLTHSTGYEPTSILTTKTSQPNNSQLPKQSCFNLFLKYCSEAYDFFKTPIQRSQQRTHRKSHSETKSTSQRKKSENKQVNCSIVEQLDLKYGFEFPKKQNKNEGISIINANKFFQTKKIAQQKVPQNDILNGLNLSKMFFDVKQKSFIVYYKTYFKSIYQVFNQWRQQLPKQWSITERRDNRSQNTIKSVFINLVQLKIKDMLYFSIQYENIPLKNDKKQFRVYLFKTKQRLIENLYSKYLESDCFKFKQQQKTGLIEKLLNDQKLKKEWESLDQKRLVVLTNQKAPQQIQKYIFQYVSTEKNRNSFLEKLSKKKMFEIYKEIICQYIENERIYIK